MKILDRLFCKHEWKFGYNVYGDEIYYSGYNRTLYYCPKCGANKYIKPFVEKDFNWNKL